MLDEIDQTLRSPEGGGGGTARRQEADRTAGDGLAPARTPLQERGGGWGRGSYPLALIPSGKSLSRGGSSAAPAASAVSAMPAAASRRRRARLSSSEIVPASSA